MPKRPDCVTIDDIRAAAGRIAGQVALTPCVHSIGLSELTGCEVYCKFDNLQRTGSFKERGGCNALLGLGEDQRRRGVVAASAGNHALALAYHGQRLGIPVTVVMPLHAPLIKLATCRRLGASVVQHDGGFRELRKRADQIAKDRGMCYVHGYDDPAVIAGQGTLALEAAEQTGGFDAIVVPVGGGGLAAGIAVATEAACPGAQVIAAEPAAMPSLTRAYAAGRSVNVPQQPTLADGLAVPAVGKNALRLLRSRVERVVQVDEHAIALAILQLFELEKAVVEGAGASGLGALLGGRLDDLRGKRVVLPLCGGNIEPMVMRRVIEHGMAAAGRLRSLQATISDRPGGLARFAQALAQAGASIEDIRHERIFAGADMSSVQIQALVQVDDAQHAARVFDRLEELGVHARDITPTQQAGSTERDA